MMKRARAASLLTLLPISVLAGCSSSSSPAPSTSAVTAQSASEYVTVIGAEDPLGITELEQLTAPHSPAYWYGLFAMGEAASVLAMGGKVSPHVTQAQTTGRVLMCPRATSATSTVSCVPFTDFTGDSDGRIVSFAIGGTPVTASSIVPTGAYVPVPFGGKVRLTVAVDSAQLVTVLHLVAGSAGLRVLGADYVPQGGQPVPAIARTTPPTLPSGRQTEMAAQFGAQSRGGVVALKVAPRTGPAVTVDIPVS